jgi:hypothetical protein
MAIQYVDKNADLCCNVAGPYVVTESNNQLSINVNGTGNQVFSLTTGTRTAADIVADLSALTGAVASVVTVNSATYVRIRTTNALGASSTIVVNSPANNCNTLLGLVATTYHGGANVAYNFVGSTKQQIINGIETALLAAGWITISGSNTTNLLMQSSLSPDPQNLRIRARIRDNGNNCAVVSIENVPGSKAGANGTGNGIQLLPLTARGWRVIANKYQVFIMSPGTLENRTFGAFGVPYLPSFLCGKIWEAAWLQANASSDTDTTSAGNYGCRLCFRVILGVDYGYTFSGAAQTQNLCNGYFWENQVVTTSANQYLVTMLSAYNGQTASVHRYWHDGSAILADPLIGWGTTNTTEGTLKGQLWDAFVSSDAYVMDTILSNIDSRNWQIITHNNVGIAQPIRGSLAIVVP